MGKVYDDWGRLVETVVRREKDRQLCLQHSRTPSDISSSSSYQLDDDCSCGEMTMARLQEDFIRILNGKNQCFDQPAMQAASLCGKCFADTGEESLLALHHQDHVMTDIISLDFLHPDRILQIKSIADAMFASGSEKEFCQAFIGFSRAVLTEHLTMLKMEELSRGEVQKMEWSYANSSIKKWCCIIKNLFGHHLGRAKDAFDHILGEYGHINMASFIESTQPSVMSLLNFGHSIVIESHKEPEWFFLFVDMYEVLASVVPGIDALFPGETGSFIRVKFYGLLTRLKDSAKVVLKEFGNYIGSVSRPYPGGRILHLSRYVVNYILRLGDYEGTLNSLLEEVAQEKVDRSGPIVDDRQDASSYPLTVCVQSLASVLEAKLNEASNLYKDMSSKHIFMTNNLHYMVEKIKNSGLRSYFGDEWIRNHVGKVRQHAICYQRVTWSSAVSLLIYDDDWRVIKARYRAFTAAFEGIYKRQTSLYVPDVELREELRVLAFETVIHAYQCFLRRYESKSFLRRNESKSFLQRFSFGIGKNHIVYTVNDLETFFLDLLEGSSKSLNHSRKRR